MANKKEEPKTLEESFEAVFEKMGILNKPKHIIKDGKLPTTFEANGTKYIVAPPEKVFNLNRKAYFDTLEIAFALNRTPSQIANSFVTLYSNQLALSSNTDSQSWINQQDKNLRDCINCLDSMKDDDYGRLPKAYFLCSLFILKEGEDLALWSPKLAHEKIDDWTKENINPFDFFAIALHSSKNSQEIMRPDWATS
jgi:hypothetical protein